MSVPEIKKRPLWKKSESRSGKKPLSVGNAKASLTRYNFPDDEIHDMIAKLRLMEDLMLVLATKREPTYKSAFASRIGDFNAMQVSLYPDDPDMLLNIGMIVNKARMVVAMFMVAMVHKIRETKGFKESMSRLKNVETRVKEKRKELEISAFGKVGSGARYRPGERRVEGKRKRIEKKLQKIRDSVITSIILKNELEYFDSVANRILEYVATRIERRGVRFTSKEIRKMSFDPAKRKGSPEKRLIEKAIRLEREKHKRLGIT